MEGNVNDLRKKDLISVNDDGSKAVIGIQQLKKRLSPRPTAQSPNRPESNRPDSKHGPASRQAFMRAGSPGAGATASPRARGSPPG
jgi:hypothetical protein